MKQRASVLLFLFILGLFAQNEPTITQLTVNDGLSQGMILTSYKPKTALFG